MRILVLDDDPARQKRFALNLFNHEIKQVFTFAEAVFALSNERFDAVFLDHDLNDHEHTSLDYGSMYGGPRELTGADVARFMANGLKRENLPRLVIVHSFNFSGVQAIISHLKPLGIEVRVEKFHPNIGR